MKCDSHCSLLESEVMMVCLRVVYCSRLLVQSSILCCNIFSSAPWSWTLILHLSVLQMMGHIWNTDLSHTSKKKNGRSLRRSWQPSVWGCWNVSCYLYLLIFAINTRECSNKFLCRWKWVLWCLFSFQSEFTCFVFTRSRRKESRWTDSGITIQQSQGWAQWTPIFKG